MTNEHDAEFKSISIIISMCGYGVLAVDKQTLHAASARAFATILALTGVPSYLGKPGLLNSNVHTCIARPKS